MHTDRCSCRSMSPWQQTFILLTRSLFTLCLPPSFHLWLHVCFLTHTHTHFSLLTPPRRQNNLPIRLAYSRKCLTRVYTHTHTPEHLLVLCDVRTCIWCCRLRAEWLKSLFPPGTQTWIAQCRLIPVHLECIRLID